MSMGLRTRTNEDEVFAKLGAWEQSVFDVAAPRTLNKVMDQAETAGLRKIAQIYRIPQREVSKYLRRTLATKGDLEAVLTARGAGFPLALFNPTQPKKGKGTYVTLKGRRVLILHAFIAMMKSGHRGVFARGAYGGKGKQRFTGERTGRFWFGKERFSINELFTFGPPEALRNKDVVDAMNDRAEEQMPKVLAQEIRFASR